MNRVLTLCIFFLLGQSLFAQDTLSIQKKKRASPTLIAIGTTAGYTGTMFALSEIWYKEDRTSFHWFDDSKEWKQMDKAGHAFSTYQLTRLNHRLFRLSGTKNSRALLYSGLSSFVMLSSVEILDGYQKEYGASISDIGANFLGTGLYIGQELLWKEQRMKLKFSYHNSAYAKERSKVLGANFPERLLKDYNGQTLWLSVDIHAFLKEESNFPKWLNIAFGYGAEEMIDGFGDFSRAQGFSPHRQYYVSIDWDLSHFKTRSKLLNSLLFVLDCIKLPAPTLSFSSTGHTSFHPLYF